MSTPIVTLERVAAVDHAAEAGRARGALVDASLSVGAGVIAVLGTPEDGSFALVDALAGRFVPRRGTVRVDGRDPSRDPAIRARIGVLGHDVELPRVRDVTELCLLASAAWTTAEPLRRSLEGLGIEALLHRRVDSLSFVEARSVELALAFATPSPCLLVLFEPFLDLVVPRERVESLVAERATSAAVILVTASPRDARPYRTALLDRGRFVHVTAPDGDALGGPFGVELVVDVRQGARLLARALTEGTDITRIALDLDPAGEAGRLRVASSDRTALGHALAAAVVASGATIDGVVESAPSMAEVRALTAWEAQRQAAFEALRHRAGLVPPTQAHGQGAVGGVPSHAGRVVHTSGPVAPPPPETSHGTPADPPGGRAR